MAIRKKVLGDNHRDTAASLSGLGVLLNAQGDHAAARPYYEQALAIRKKVLGDNHPETAGALHNLGVVLSSHGDYAAARPYYDQALAIHKKALGDNHPRTALSLNNLGFLLYSQGDYAAARPYYDQALAIRKKVLGDNHPDTAISLNNLGVLLFYQGDVAAARPYYEQALAISKKVLGDSHPDTARSLNNLAMLYLSQEDYAAARRYYEQALSIHRKLNHPFTASSLNNLGDLLQAQGDYAKAEAFYRQAVLVLRLAAVTGSVPFEYLAAAELKALPETVRHLRNLARCLHSRLGQTPSAAQLRACDHPCSLAQAILDRLRHEVLKHDESKTQHGADYFELFPERIGLMRQLYALEAKPADLETAFVTAEQGTARVFLESLGKARGQAIAGVGAELLAQEQQLLQAIRLIDLRVDKEQDRPLDKRDASLIGKLYDERKQREAELQALIARMEKEYPQYAGLKYPRPCSVAEARACLAANEVALLFVPGKEASYVVLLEARPAADDKANGLAIFELADADALADLAESLTDRDTLALPARSRRCGADGYQKLLAPLQERIKGKDLVIVPGGALCHLPFELLVESAPPPQPSPTKGRGRYLIETHQIRYAASLTVLHLSRQWEKTRGKPDQALWAAGDPVYDAQDARLTGQVQVADASRDRAREYLSREGGVAFSRLVHSGREVEVIGKLMGSAEVLTGVQASESAVKTASASGKLARCRYLHFATHGILGLDKGQQPALVLSLVGNDGKTDEAGVNDGFLRLDEVTHLKLNADLVVLSACRTGQGRLHDGEGVRGLSRAFLYAGSRGVLCSLWSVDDQETSNLMTALYGHLKAGQASADALRTAQLEMIQAGKAPLYWAPFILIGE